MTATPSTVAASVRRRRDAARPSAVVYTTSTGDAPRTAPTPVTPAVEEDYVEWCFACSRPSNHVGEHDELVDAGLVTYDGGYVVRTAAYDGDLAARISDAEYRVYVERILALEL